MKKVLALLLVLIITAVCFSACSKNENGNDAKKEESKTAQSVSMYDLYKAMIASSDKLDESAMQYASSSDDGADVTFKKVSYIDYAKVDSYFITAATDGASNCDELVVIQLKDAADVNEAVESLNTHLSKRKDLYKTYAPELLPKLELARVFSQDNLAVLIICDDPDAVQTALKDFVK